MFLLSFRIVEGRFGLVSDQGGVSRFDGQRIVAYGTTAHELNDTTQKIVEDRWGRIWVLNKKPKDRTGFVAKYNGNDFEYVADATCLNVDNIGDIWIGSDNTITRFTATNSNDEITGFQLNLNIAPNSKINVIFQSHEDTLWIAGNDERGAFILRLQGDIHAGHSINLERFDNLPNILHDATIHSITKDSVDNLWFGGPSLLLRYDGTQFKQVLDTSEDTAVDSHTSDMSDRLAAGKVSVNTDSQGRIWFSDTRQLRWWDGENLHKLRSLSLETDQDDYIN